MNNFENLLFSFKEVILCVVFIGIFYVCLIPFSININGTGITANYFYVFFPLIFLIPGIKRRLIFRREPALIISFFILLYLVTSTFEVINNGHFSFRRFLSFLVFVLPITLAFIEFQKKDLYFFKMAVLLACFYYSAHKVMLFSTLTLGYDWYFNFVSTPSSLDQFWGPNIRDIQAINLKGIVGSQRYGFLLIFGFLISLFEPRLFFYKVTVLQRSIIAFFLLFSCLLTFSRATFITLIFVGVFFIYRKYFKSNKENGVSMKTSLKVKMKALTILVGLVFFIFGLFYFFGDSGFLAYYKSRFVQPFMYGTESFMTNPNSSEGYRFMLFSRVIDYVSLHPFTGSGFQGLYLLYDEFKGVGSVHNQYLDVLLRVGLIGTFFWLYFLYRIYKFCKIDMALIYGFVGILFFGIFHETFKLSYGSFIFGILLSFSYSFFPSNSK